MKCAHCGKSPDTRSCPSCQAETLKEGLYCHRCGVRLDPWVPSSNSTTEGEEDFSQRILCSDGTCIGVINEQGLCKICGKPYAGSP